MATSITLEKFESGDISLWLRQFEVCANVNSWDNDKELKVLHAFLRGPAATHYFEFSDAQKESYNELKKGLIAALCPQLTVKKFTQSLKADLYAQMKTVGAARSSKQS